MSQAALAAPAPPRAWIGLALGVAGFGLFSTMDAVVKALSGGHSLVQIIFFMNLFGLVPLAVFAARSGGAAALSPRRPVAQILRATAWLSAAFCYFFAFSEMALHDAYAIAFSAPLLITALSAAVLGERVGLRRWAAVAVGFLGVLIMLRPGGGMLQIGALGALGGVVSFSTAMLLARRLGGDDGPAAMWATNVAVALAVSGIVLPFGFFAPMSWGDLGLLAAAGLLNGVAQVALIQAFRVAPAAAVAPFQYTQMFWGLLYGYLFFGDGFPDGVTLAGAGVVAASGLFVLTRRPQAA